MAGTGTGHPNWFMCPGERNDRSLARIFNDSKFIGTHIIGLTGNTRPTKRDGHGHPRKSWTTRQWVCSCGRTGWSNHIDLEHKEARNDPR